MGAGGGFGVVFDAKDGVVAVAHAFDGVVVEVHVGNGDVRIGEGVGVDTEAVVLRGDFDFVGGVIDDGVIGAVVAKFKFVGFAAEGKAENLVAETDAEDGDLADELFDFGGLVL